MTKWNETVVRTGAYNDQKVIGVITKTRGSRFHAHSIHYVATKSFVLKWEAANHLHAIHDNRT